MDVAVALGAVRRTLADGCQAFVVCPLVEGSEKLQGTSAVAELDRSAAEELAGLRRFGACLGEKSPIWPLRRTAGEGRIRVAGIATLGGTRCVR